MPRFELVFGTYFNDGDKELFDIYRYSRVIFAEDDRCPDDDVATRTMKNKRLACSIANDMASNSNFVKGRKVTTAGEEVNSFEYLDDVKGVNETDKEYSSYWNDIRAWKRVLKNLGLKESDVEFIVEEIGVKVFRVGFRLLR